MKIGRIQLVCVGVGLMFSGVAALAPVKAQQSHDGHGAMHGKSAAASAKAPSTKAYQDANDKMHKGMGIDFSGDADVDFARGMIPHHQGAIDMARVVLQHGKDPGLRKLAEDIIKAQDGEIAYLKEWLKKKGK